MSAIFCDGFDTYSSPFEKYALLVGNAGDTSITTAYSRNGGQALRFAGVSTYAAVVRSFGAAAHATIIVHFALRRALHSGSALFGPYVSLRSPVISNWQGSLIPRNNGTITIHRGSTSGVQVAVTGAVVPVDTWVHIGWRYTVAASPNGSTQLWVDGVKHIDISGINTQGDSPQTVSEGIVLGGISDVSPFPGQIFDDVVVLNGAGATNNAYLGDVQALALRVNGAGDRTQLAPVGEITNWQNVDDVVHTASDYNASNTDGQADLYAMENLPANVGVHFVQQTSYVRKNLAGSKSVAQILKVGSTEYPQAAVALGTSFAPVDNIYEVNPATSAGWTSTELNAAQAGVEVRA